MPTRSETLMAPVPPRSRVIEIGPSFNPVAPKAAGWDARSVDHLNRAGLVAKYTNDPTVDVNRIEDVDYVWSEGLISDVVPSELHGTFDAFVASHVIEHTPDLIAFLDSAATLLKPAGTVVLAVPDKRYCFDYFQPLTTTGQLLEAHAERRTRHTQRIAFDHVAYAALDRDIGAWGQHPLSALQFAHPIEQARDLFNALEKQQSYTDVHAWRFTPASFELLLLELARLDRTDWRIERTTEAVGCEFYAWLRRGGKAVAAALSPAALQAKRLGLLKRTLLETRAQIDWLLAGEPELVTGPLGLLPTATPTTTDIPRFVDWFPTPDNAARAFENEWSSAVPGLPGTGQANLFEDGRIIWFEKQIGGFVGKRVLELGPLEGGHTHMMTQRGATVTAIESNMRSWMRCLIVKDVLKITNATFLLGDFLPYLAARPPPVDFLLASGVLYHMTEPADFLRALCAASDTIGIWTHYYDAAVLLDRHGPGKFDITPRKLTTPRGRTVELYEQRYLQALDWGGFCGGSAPTSSWLRREDILGIIEDEGFIYETFLDQSDHPNGPAFCVFARRQPAGQRLS